MNSTDSIHLSSNNSCIQADNSNYYNKNSETLENNQQLQDKFNEIMSSNKNTTQINENNNGKLSLSEIANDNSSNLNQMSSNKEDLSLIFSQLLQNTTTNNNNLTVANSDVSSISTIDPIESQKIIDELVEHILISDTKNTGEQEVIIKLGHNSILDGTEIILKRALDGTLGVLINPKDKNQFKTIIDVKQDLELALQKHEKGMINVVVNDLSPQNVAEYYNLYQYV